MSEPYSTPVWAEPDPTKRARYFAQLTTRDVLPALIGWRSRKKLDRRDSAARKIIWELLCALGLQIQKADQLTRENEAANAMLDDARKQIVRMGPVYSSHNAAMLVATRIAAETGRYIVHSSVQEDGTAFYQLSDGTLVQHALPGFGPHAVTINKDGKTIALDRVSPSGELDETDLALIKLLLADPEPKSSGSGPTVAFTPLLESVLRAHGLDFGAFQSFTSPEGGFRFPSDGPESGAGGSR
jgi:hypothetical protein